MSHSKECVGCKAVVAEEEISSYSLIGNGWRLTRSQTPEGAIVEWRCPRCWAAYKATQVGKASQVK
jgi:hypothetical protein